jgi:hypothetical protein
VYLYVISCRLDRVKIGVAADAEKRLRELQVGSPVELRLALTRPYAERRDADAVADELYRHFAGRRDRGSWYRLTVTEVRERLAQRASLEAPARARAAAEAATAERRAPRRGGQQLRARTEQQLAYERRRRQERTRKQKRAAKLLGQGMTTTLPPRSSTTTTPDAASNRQPSAALANNATTPTSDRPTAIKHVAFPPKGDAKSWCLLVSTSFLA